MTELPFPSSGGLLDAFLQRMRFSPNTRVDITWLVECMGISQRANAGQTHRWLQAACILDKEGYLTERGRVLLLPTNERYERAAREALEATVGSDALFKNLILGRIDRKTLRNALLARHNVGESTVNKAIAGIYAVAELAGEDRITSALGRPGVSPHKPKYPEFDLGLAKEHILARFELFTGRTGGIDDWLNPDTRDITFERLTKVKSEPLTAPQLNQLLTLSHAPPLSDGFFQYYWLSRPPHTYDLEAIRGFRSDWKGSLGIFDLDQLYWGLYRFYVDALLYFGNVRRAYQVLREMDYDSLSDLFRQQRVDTDGLVARGPSLPLVPIARDDRYLIAEQACKSYATRDKDDVDIETALREAFRHRGPRAVSPVTIADLLAKEKNPYLARKYPNKALMFAFAANEILDEPIASEDDLERVLCGVRNRFMVAHAAALENTTLYLSSVAELDVYVATSMRSRQDFYTMSDFCRMVFGHRALRKYNLRFFDPTLSAAEKPED